VGGREGGIKEWREGEGGRGGSWAEGGGTPLGVGGCLHLSRGDGRPWNV